jgi:hypothetical protein
LQQNHYTATPILTEYYSETSRMPSFDTSSFTLQRVTSAGTHPPPQFLSRQGGSFRIQKVTPTFSLHCAHPKIMLFYSGNLPLVSVPDWNFQWNPGWNGSSTDSKWLFMESFDDDLTGYRR